MTDVQTIYDWLAQIPTGRDFLNMEMHYPGTIVIIAGRAGNHPIGEAIEFVKQRIYFELTDEARQLRGDLSDKESHRSLLENLLTITVRRGVPSEHVIKFIEDCLCSEFCQVFGDDCFEKWDLQLPAPVTVPTPVAPPLPATSAEETSPAMSLQKIFPLIRRLFGSNEP